MPYIHMRVSGVWKLCTGVYARVSGSWKRITQAWVRQGGVWKLVYQYAGQIEFLSQGTSNLVVPAGVSQLHVALVGGSGNTLSQLRRGATVLISSDSAISSHIGGGDGGFATTGTGSGGGGAGGYSSSGGGGGHGSGGVFGNGGDGGGGGGGGGAADSSPSTRQNGAGVYLHGEGVSGAGGKRSGAVLPVHGSNFGEGSPRGAGRKAVDASNLAMAGGNLRYTITPLAVTPGETLQVVVGSRPSTGGTNEMQGGVRIIWGEGRSYPSNAKDV